MKKFVSKIMFAAVAILSATGFTSCNNTDDDPYVPTQAPVQEKPMYKEFPTYAASLSNDILDMYDVTLVLHNGDQSQEVVLTKANGEAKEYSGNETTTYYKYSFTNVNGEDGVYSVEANVTPKADIKNIIENMPAGTKGIFVYGADIVKAIYNNDSGKNVGEVFRNENSLSFFLTSNEMMEITEDGTFVYERQGKDLEEYLTRKIQ